MEGLNIEQLKYPIGHLNIPNHISDEQIHDCIQEIKLFPSRLKSLTTNLSTDQLNWRYRPQGWKIKQVAHHCLDSHINCYVRFKLSLTESNPTIRPYQEGKWAELSWSKKDDISNSVLMLELLHTSLTEIMSDLEDEQLEKAYHHPADKRDYKLKEAIVLYAWHCNHHLAHIEQAIKSGGIY